LLNTYFIYLRLEGTLSANLVFQDSELLTIRNIENDVRVENEIIKLGISLE